MPLDATCRYDSQFPNVSVIYCFKQLHPSTRTHKHIAHSSTINHYKLNMSLKSNLSDINGDKVYNSLEIAGNIKIFYLYEGKSNTTKLLATNKNQLYLLRNCAPLTFSRATLTWNDLISHVINCVPPLSLTLISVHQ